LTKRKISASTVIPLIMSSSTTRFNYDGDATLAPIVIIFQKTGFPDDKLVIRPTEGSMNFTAVFTQNTIGARTERQLLHSELFSYIERFLESLHYDLQRCDFVQIDVPGYTSVMLKSTETHYYMDTFYAQVRSLHNSWPMEVEGTRIQPRATSPFAWSSYTVPAATQTQQTQVETTTRPKRSASPRVTRAAARRAAF
jgi:hypothetical protein